MVKTLQAERDNLAQARLEVNEEVNTLRRVVQQHQQESKNRESMLETKILQLENLAKNRYVGSALENLWYLETLEDFGDDDIALRLHFEVKNWVENNYQTNLY